MRKLIGGNWYHSAAKGLKNEDFWLKMMGIIKWRRYIEIDYMQ